MLTIELENLPDLNRSLDKLVKDVKNEAQRSLGKVGRFVESEQKDRCPFGPTKSQAQAAGKSFVKGSSPGTLENSIGLILGNGYVDVGVLFGDGQKYGAWINYGNYNLGPGSIAKNGTTSVDVGRLYVERGYEENEDDVVKIFQDGLGRPVDKFNRG